MSRQKASAARTDTGNEFTAADLLKGRLIDLRRQRELYSLQNHGLRRSVPCGLLLRGREHARHPPGRMHRLRGLRAGMPGRRDQARHRAGAREMAVAERGIRENLAKYYGQKSAPARSGRGSRTNSSTSRQIPARVIEADSARAATFTFAVCQPWCGRSLTSAAEWTDYARDTRPRRKFALAGSKHN